MAKYRKKPVLIEALQWTPNQSCAEEMDEFMGGYAEVQNSSLVIETLEGTMLASPGDFIIKGIKGEFYPCKPDIFEATYEVAE